LYWINNSGRIVFFSLANNEPALEIGNRSITNVTDELVVSFGRIRGAPGLDSRRTESTKLLVAKLQPATHRAWPATSSTKDVEKVEEMAVVLLLVP
jgi:hypothetical protein